MTDRHAAYLVVLADNVREDDAEATISALHMIRGVIGVKPVAADVAQQIAAMRVDNAWRERILALLRDERN